MRGLVIVIVALAIVIWVDAQYFDSVYLNGFRSMVADIAGGPLDFLRP